jgi:hypothetical protein
MYTFFIRHPANPANLLTSLFKGSGNPFNAVTLNHNHHTNATVERFKHFRLGYSALFGQPFEDWRQFPSVQIDCYALALI